MTKKTGAFLIADGSKLDELAEGADYLVVDFGRANVEKCLTGDAMDRLLSLSDRTEWVHRFKDKVYFVFSGFDGAPGEIYQNKACRNFFGALDAQWPFWFHFAEKEGETLLFLLAMKMEIEVVKAAAGRIFTRPRNHRQLGTQLHLWFEGMNNLHDRHGISAEDNMAMTDRVLSAITGQLT